MTSSPRIQFYLGKSDEARVTYDPRDLVTHAVCVGMTGSGKTGLCVGLLEEVALAGVPAIVIDPKGDLGNLLLSFEDLQPSDFRPWVQGNGCDAGKAADREAERWAEGLREWGLGAADIARLRNCADFTIYTPGSTAGRSLSILRSFEAGPTGAAWAFSPRRGPLRRSPATP